MTDIAQYRGMLPTSKHRLDEELEARADIMGRISAQVVIMNSRMIDAKDKLATVEARLALSLKENDPKITVAMIDAEVQVHRDRIDAWRAYQAARAEHEDWAGLLDAWREKGRDITTMGQLYRDQYWTLTTIEGPARTQSQRDIETEALRATIRRNGHQDRAVDTKPPEPAPTPSRRQRVQS